MSTNRRIIALKGILFLALLTRGGVLHADTDAYEKIPHVKVGDKAPVFESLDDLGNTWQSKHHVGKKMLVVVFYMGDFFKPCCHELSAFRDDLARIRAAKAALVAVSGDSVSTHQMFKETYALNFPLLADYKGEVGKAFGVAMSGGGVQYVKTREGKKLPIQRGVTPARWTFIIDKDGRVIYKNMSVKPQGHSREILAVLKKLNERR
jgi:peroxiredoxin Q/BCP